MSSYISIPPEPASKPSRRQPLKGAQLTKAPSVDWWQSGVMGKWITQTWPIVKAYAPVYESMSKSKQSKLVKQLCEQLFTSDPFLWQKVGLSRMERWLRFSLAAVKWHMQQQRLKQGKIEVLDNKLAEYEMAFTKLVAECRENSAIVAANASIEQSNWGGKREGAGRPKSLLKYTRGLHKTIKSAKNV